MSFFIKEQNRGSFFVNIPIYIYILFKYLIYLLSKAISRLVKDGNKSITPKSSIRSCQIIYLLLYTKLKYKLHKQYNLQMSISYYSEGIFVISAIFYSSLFYFIFPFCLFCKLIAWSLVGRFSTKFSLSGST